MSRRDFVCGKTGSGKSRCVREYLLTDRPRVIVVDPVGDYASGEPRTFSVTDCLEQVRQHVYMGRRSWRVVLSVGREDIGDLVESLTPSRDVYSSWCRSVGGITVVLEEVDLLTPRGQHGEKISSLFRRGRHAGVSVIAVTQRPGNVSKETIAQADRVIAYRLTNQGDIGYLRVELGGEAMDCAALAWQRPYSALVKDGESVGILSPEYTVAGIGKSQLQLEA